MRTPEEVLENTVRRCRERDIIIPTYREMADPTLVPDGIRSELADIGLWDLHSRNLFRITWKNEPVETGGGFGGVNFIELPPELTGVEARIFMLVGKYFPTGAHKVGATFGPLVEKLVRGAFDPDHPEGAVAVDRQLLPRRRLRRGPAGLSVDRGAARGHVARAIRVARKDRFRDLCDPGFGVQRQGDLRQDQGAQGRAWRRDRGPQPVRRVRQRHLALRLHRAGDGGGLRGRARRRTRALPASV